VHDFLIRRNTSLTLTPEQIHEIGLNEVARLEAELEGARRGGLQGNGRRVSRLPAKRPPVPGRIRGDIGERMMTAIADRAEGERFFRSRRRRLCAPPRPAPSRR
jgi:hypothetical protein